MMDANTRIKYYSREDTLNEILYNSKNKEVVARFNDSFGKRPDVIQYPQDIITLVKNGATSFHCSVESWKNPLQLTTTLDKRSIKDIRIGWDLIIDIDCKIWELSKLTAYLIINALRNHGISAISCKFSGNKGFHIGVPYEAFILRQQIQNKEIKELFPDCEKRILSYLLYYIDRKENKFELTSLILSKLTSTEIAKRLNVGPNDIFRTICEICGRAGKPTKVKEEIACPVCQTLNDAILNPITCKKCNYIISIPHYKKKDSCRHCGGDFKDKLDVAGIIGLDTILISHRHLYRMAYSLHETTGLCSLPINPDEVLGFEKEYAKPENVNKIIRFLNREDVVEGQGENLITNAYDFTFTSSTNKAIKSNKFEMTLPNVSINAFPPCIKLILTGLSDGRKRGLFILLNFLSSLKWNQNDIRKLIKEWNTKNKEHLSNNYIESQLNYHFTNKKEILPPNCKNLSYYVDMGVCKPDNLCAKIKNPVSYAIKRVKFPELRKIN